MVGNRLEQVGVAVDRPERQLEVYIVGLATEQLFELVVVGWVVPQFVISFEKHFF